MTELEKKIRQYLSQEDAEKLLKRKKHFISLSTTEVQTTLFSSKVGGYGYFPRELSYPLNKEHQPLSLLAQINFSEMPKLDRFPEKGILAFYVDYFDDLIGMDIDNPTEQTGFKVYYFPAIVSRVYSKTEQEALFKPFEQEELYKIVEKEQKLIGILAETIPVGSIVEFTETMGIEYDDFVAEKMNEDDQEEAFYNLNPFETGIGGYPSFTQTDPREYDKELEERYNFLLFQLDTDSDNIMWGDSGIGNFFINDQSLANKDFSDILYNWDCY